MIMKTDKKREVLDFEFIFRLMREDYSKNGLDAKSTKYAARRALSGDEFIEALLRNKSKDFSGVYIYNLKCAGIDLSYANLKGAWLSNVEIPRSMLNGSGIDCAYITGNLKGVDFRDSIIRKSRIEGDLSAADFSRSIIYRSELTGVFNKTMMDDIHMIDTTITDKKSYAYLNDTKLH